jgi:hypothetical protein
MKPWFTGCQMGCAAGLIVMITQQVPLDIPKYEGNNPQGTILH